MKTVTSEKHEEEPIRKFIAQELNFAISLANHIHRTLVEINKMIRSPSPGHNNAISLIMDIANQRVSKFSLTEFAIEGPLWNFLLFLSDDQKLHVSSEKKRNFQVGNVPIDLIKMFSFSRVSFENSYLF